jgi:hypothetical protein
MLENPPFEPPFIGDFPAPLYTGELRRLGSTIKKPSLAILLATKKSIMNHELLSMMNH